MNKIFFAIILIFLSVGCVSAENVTSLSSTEGSSYINWTWNKDNLTQIAIWIDGEFVQNSSLNYFILSDLQLRETHTIDIVNFSNSSLVYASDEAMTLYPYVLYYILILLSLGFLMLELLFTKVNVMCILFGVLCFFISLITFYFSFTYYLSPFSYIMIGIAAISVVWILGSIFTMLSEGRSYEEEIM